MYSYSQAPHWTPLNRRRCFRGPYLVHSTLTSNVSIPVRHQWSPRSHWTPSRGIHGVQRLPKRHPRWSCPLSGGLQAPLRPLPVDTGFWSHSVPSLEESRLLVARRAPMEIEVGYSFGDAPRALHFAGIAAFRRSAIVIRNPIMRIHTN